MEQLFDHRKSPRKPVTLTVGCRTQGGMRETCTLLDISTHGCCLMTATLHLSVGMRVSLKPEGLAGLLGSVRWITGNHAGIEFDEPLYLPVAEHIAEHHARQPFPASRADAPGDALRLHRPGGEAHPYPQ